jgi:hypothetical protein
MKTQSNEAHRALCDVRLGEISQTDITNLTEFAERRLVAMGLNPSDGEDVCQLALTAILRGLESDQGGRVPRLMDLENKDTFLNFVRGAISSIIFSMSRTERFSPIVESLNENITGKEGLSPLIHAELVEMNDLKDQLFPRLRARAPKRLQRTIDAWESVFTESDRIPAPVHRKYIKEIKSLAREIVMELGGVR